MTDTNPFLTGSLSRIYFRTAIPIIFVMAMNGLLAIADALFLGHYVGPEALAAVTLMFPIYMLVIALATLVSNGMSSILARHLGGGRITEAQAIFAGAHGLALAAGVLMIALYLTLGEDVVLLVAGGSQELADMGSIYLQITVLFSPLMFVLSVNSDALRNEGRVGLMAAMSLLVSLANIAFNYLLIAEFQMGVAGSAYGTAAAEGLALVLILAFRLRGRTHLRPIALIQHGWLTGWSRILALGAPQSLNYMGVALGSATVIAALQITRTDNYEATVSAYGILTRVFTFSYLPLLGLSHAMQTVTGNNYGSGQWRRSNRSLSIALAAAVIYSSLSQMVMTGFAAEIGGAFVDDPAVVAEVARILPIVITLLFLSGPLMMIAAYFQAIGDAGRAAILGLSRTYLFSIPLTFALPLHFGETGIWLASPVAESLLLALTVLVLWSTARRRRLRWGLFPETS